MPDFLLFLILSMLISLFLGMGNFHYAIFSQLTLFLMLSCIIFLSIFVWLCMGGRWKDWFWSFLFCLALGSSFDKVFTPSGISICSLSCCQVICRCINNGITSRYSSNKACRSSLECSHKIQIYNSSVSPDWNLRATHCGQICGSGLTTVIVIPIYLLWKFNR